MSAYVTRETITLNKIYHVTYEEKENQHSVHSAFRLREKYYVQIDNQFYPIKNQKGLINLLVPQKKELIDFSKANRLNKEKAEVAYLKLLNYYETLQP